MKRITGLAVWMISFSIQAQSMQEKAPINRLCGCFEADFRYAETFSPDQEYLIIPGIECMAKKVSETESGTRIRAEINLFICPGGSNRRGCSKGGFPF